MTRTIFVSGATGHQGRNVLNHLLKSNQNQNLHIKAFARKEEELRTLRNMTDSSKSGNRHRVEHIVGDLRDSEQTFPAISGCDCVILITNYAAFSDDINEGCRVETSVGRRIMSEAINAGVKDFVYSSVAGAGVDRNVPHFWSKKLIEDELERNRDKFRSLQIVRLCSFMENIEQNEHIKRRLSQERKLALPLPKETKMNVVCLADVGRALADCALNPHLLDHHNGIIELAAEIISIEEICRELNVEFEEADPFSIPEAYRNMYTLFKEGKIQPSVVDSNKYWPTMTSFREWARRSFGAQTGSRIDLRKEIDLPMKEPLAGGISFKEG
ncbi:hypothetical protein P9112_003856 [Eukaryota sp. TZLM1-RC]